MEIEFLEQILLNSPKSPALIASTLFGLMRQSGLSLDEIKMTADFLRSHVDIDRAVTGM